MCSAYYSEDTGLNALQMLTVIFTQLYQAVFARDRWENSNLGLSNLTKVHRVEEQNQDSNLSSLFFSKLCS